MSSLLPSGWLAPTLYLCQRRGLRRYRVCQVGGQPVTGARVDTPALPVFSRRIVGCRASSSLPSVRSGARLGGAGGVGAGRLGARGRGGWAPGRDPGTPSAGTVDRGSLQVCNRDETLIGACVTGGRYSRPSWRRSTRQRTRGGAGGTRAAGWRR